LAGGEQVSRAVLILASNPIQRGSQFLIEASSLRARRSRSRAGHIRCRSSAQRVKLAVRTPTTNHVPAPFTLASAAFASGLHSGEELAIARRYTPRRADSLHRRLAKPS